MTEYTQSITNANTAIRKKGRDICIQRTVITTSTSTPWTVPTDSPSSHLTKGVFLDYSSHEVDGTLILAEDQKVLVAALGLDIVPTTKDKIIDGDDTWAIKAVKPLKPGDEAIIYELQVRR